MRSNLDRPGYPPRPTGGPGVVKLDWEIVVERPVNVVSDVFMKQMWDVMRGHRNRGT